MYIARLEAATLGMRLDVRLDVSQDVSRKLLVLR